MKWIKYILLAMLSIFVSCNTNLEYLEPEYLDGSILDGTSTIPDNIKSNFEGIYNIKNGSDTFGDRVAFKWVGDKLIVYGSKFGSYFKLGGGVQDTVFLFEGSWRHMQNVDVGLLRLKISVEDGALDLWNNSVKPGSVKLKGSFGFEDNPNQKELTLEYYRPFSEEAKNSKFLIVAHRGGGRNSDYLGASENTLEMIAMAEELGGNGIEIDVKLSKDNIPFLYHDKNINLRLTQESPIQGPIEDFTFSQLRTFVRLKNGERIPSVKEALEFVLMKTTLRFVWLDMKSTKNAMPFVIPIQQDIMKRTKEMGRDLVVVIGIPNEDKQALFLEYPNSQNIESINEMTVDDVRKTNSYAWGPRWTMGSQTSLVREIHSEGRIAITWTVDQIQFITTFINESEFDGFVTNYPTIVAYYNYAR